MAPSRRKGAGKAASGAAVRREWNVGDLVLAKVKGYPAWPAVVSEPEKWGYPDDRKKTLVHFFGTQQIAFCNPADVEEFTEEKKTSLLGKRHGKGADFVRAVNEIIVCFEKLKKQDGVSTDNGAQDIINENDPEASFTKSVKDCDSVIKAESFNPGATNDLNSLTEAAAAAAAEDALHDEMRLEEAHSNFVFAETPVSTPYSTRSKTDVPQSRNYVAKRRMSARRLRSSSKKDTSGLQNIMLPSTSNTRSSRLSGTDASYVRSLRRSNRIQKSPYDSEGCDLNSRDFLSNDSTEENGSEIMTGDSDTPSFNDGSTVESHCKPLEVEPSSDNNEEDVELYDKLEFPTNGAFVKKRRKPKVKKHRDDIIVTAKMGEVVSDAEMLRTECISPRNIYAREDGDDHLPLVKRARVRMGKPASAVEENSPVHEEENMLQVPECLAMQPSRPLNCRVDDPGYVESVSIGDPANFSLSHLSPAKKPQLLETRMHFADGEAALPPSKRLNRALEAMSANVAEDSQRATYCQLRVSTVRNGKDSSFAECTDRSTGAKAVIEMRAGSVENRLNDDSDSGGSQFCVGSNMEMPEIDSKTCDLESDCVNNSINNKNPESYEDSIEHAEGADSKCIQRSPLDEPHANNEAKNQLVKSGSPNIGEEVIHLDDSASKFTVSPIGGCKIESSEVNEAFELSGPDISQMNSKFNLVEEISGGSLNGGAGIQIDNGEGEGDGNETHSTIHQVLAENNEYCQRSETLKETSSGSTDSNAMSSMTHAKVLTNVHHQCLFKSMSVSDDHLEDRTVSVLQSSSSLTDGPVSVARVSPPSSVTCNISASDKKNYLDSFNSCNPDIQLLSEMAGKSNNKGDALSSFEVIIRTLTRTKESIGKATRIAIECATYGFAYKVVEMLAQNLERESNSHKKVDLFFLVDSIAQCSRGIKGDGGTYPLAIQAMLPRLLLAAAPPASSSLENHRQCLKVLRVWQERKILPEPVIRRHIRELDSFCCTFPTGGSRRPLRNERAFDDPIREMEGMLVDEYGSNSSFQLAGFCMPPMLRDDGGGSDSDGENFEAVTPEHNTENFAADKTPILAVEKRRHILEDVDGELEMEDVAPCYEAEITSTSNIAGDCGHVPHLQSENQSGPPFSSEQPKDVPLERAPLQRSPLNPPPLRHNGYHHAAHDISDGSNSNFYPSSQYLDSRLSGSISKQSALPRSLPTTLDSWYHRSHDKFFQSQVPRRMPDSNTCSFSDRPTSHLSARGSNRIQPADSAFRNGPHLHPPHPAPSNQFSYLQEHQFQSRRDTPPPSQPHRSCDAENGNFYRGRGRNKFVRCDNIGECWRPSFPSSSGPCYRNGARMAHYPVPYRGPPREPSLNDNRWNFPPLPLSHRQFNSYRHPSDPPIPVASRGPNFWRPR